MIQNCCLVMPESYLCTTIKMNNTNEKINTIQKNYPISQPLRLPTLSFVEKWKEPYWKDMPYL